MKQLIINADDFGLSESINNGIIDGYKKKAVTDISIFADGEAFNHAIELARNNNVKNIGAHILLNKKKAAPKKYYMFSWEYFLGMVKPEEIYAEIKRQTLKIKENGFNISHIDSHQHIHMAPHILRVFVKIAKELGIKFIRFPYEKGFYGFKSIILKASCILSKNILIDSGIKYNNYFLGHLYSGKLNKKNLLKIIPKIKEGVTELSCHPGYLDDEVREKYPWHRNCEDELNALLGPEFSEKIKEHNIKLASFSEI